MLYYGGNTFCPMVTPGVPLAPHSGGSIVMGVPTIQIGF